ncbi:MAG: DUF2384 domain-containing protein [Cyclobacteriaceae bacterium]|nr:DUF2384 domain-containing protein [Cyclobacteriaceae bacterium HetDA_MAG_MS6]
MKVEEPLATYGIQPATLDSDYELIQQARKGLRTSMLWDFLKSIDSTKAEFEAFLPYSLKTFSRKKLLNEEISERILNIIRVFKKGEEFFGNVPAFKRWLDKHHPILGDQPSKFLNTSTGCQIVLDELGRAEHGVMA